MKQPLAVVDVGLVTPVGLDAEQTASSFRAGISRKSETSMMDKAFRPITLGSLPDDVLPPLAPALAKLRPALTSLQTRLLRLAGPALQEAVQARLGQEPIARVRPLPLYLAGPRPGLGRPEIVGPAFVQNLALQAGVDLDRPHSGVFPTGHAGFFAALEAAHQRLIDHGTHEFALVGGIDSYVDLYRLAALDAEERLRTTGPQDAFTPGEGAAFVLVASPAACQRHRLEPVAWITALGQGLEPGHRYSAEPHRAQGLCDALNELFSPLPTGLPPIATVMGGLTGEVLGAKEWGVASLRHTKRFANPIEFEHPAELTGDMGAALAGAMTAVAAMSLRHHGGTGPILVWAASDHAERGATLLRSQTSMRGAQEQ